MKHCHVHCMQKSIYSLFIKIRGLAHKVNKLDGWQNARTRAAADILMEKNETTSVSKAHWYINSRKEVTGNDFYLQLPRLPTATVSISWTVNVATRLTSSSHNSVRMAL